MSKNAHYANNLRSAATNGIPVDWERAFEMATLLAAEAAADAEQQMQLIRTEMQMQRTRAEMQEPQKRARRARTIAAPP